MIYIKDADYEYISNKYHDTKKPFDPFMRYIRRDEIFDENTGMNGDDIKQGIFENDKKYEHLPHCIRKARGLEFVLKNTRISCDSRDIFPAINSTDRLLRVTLSDMWRNEILQNVIPENHAERINLQRKGVATIWLDYDHSVPIWDRLFDLGFSGILADSENIRKQKGKLSEEKEAFYESIKIEYEAIIGIVKRMSLLAKNTKGSEKLAVALDNISQNPPKTFYEALLLIYIYFMICEHIEGLQVRSLCNFDRQLYKFYKHDIENGVSEEQIREEIAYFFLQFTAIGNYWGQPVYLGGENADGSSVINELSYIFVDVYDKMGIFNPKVQIKVAESTPEKFMLKVLDMIRRGRNSFVLVGDKLIRQSLIKNLGVTEEEARLCDVKGCYEYAKQGDFGTGMNYINLVKPLEFVLHGGYDGIDQSFILQKSPAPYEYKTFDDLYAEYKKQLFALIDKTVEIVNGYEDYLAEINPLPMLSATIPDCLEKGLDAIARKSVSCSSFMMFGAIADVVDSLTMLKKYVYDRKELTLEEFVSIIDNNFEGHELFRQKLLNDREKYGNNKDFPDSLAVDIDESISGYLNHRKNASNRGGYWFNAGYHVARQYYEQGKKTASLPSGRLKGEELAKNSSPCVGQNREGATAAILTVTKVDATNCVGDVCLDLGVLPSAVKGDDGLQALYGLVKTYFNRGGHALQINIVDAETLRDAQKNPEKYADLQIRVAGWNVLWNNIPPHEQEGFIKQAEALI
ncbi:MAG: hypothetical protein J6C23_01040 [Clostridia bacterium]|nr:hypothetical protein [Clostridia bacterium]